MVRLRFVEMVENHRVQVERPPRRRRQPVGIEPRPLFVRAEVRILPRHELGDDPLLGLQNPAHERQLLVVVAERLFDVLVDQQIVALHRLDDVETAEVAEQGMEQMPVQQAVVVKPRRAERIADEEEPLAVIAADVEPAVKDSLAGIASPDFSPGGSEKPLILA